MVTCQRQGAEVTLSEDGQEPLIIEFETEDDAEAFASEDDPPPLTEAEIEYNDNLFRYGKKAADWVAAGEPDNEDR